MRVLMTPFNVWVGLVVSGVLLMRGVLHVAMTSPDVDQGSHWLANVFCLLLLLAGVTLGIMLIE